jgi:hypothetical protein
MSNRKPDSCAGSRKYRTSHRLPAYNKKMNCFVLAVEIYAEIEENITG